MRVHPGPPGVVGGHRFRPGGRARREGTGTSEGGGVWPALPLLLGRERDGCARACRQSRPDAEAAHHRGDLRLVSGHAGAGLRGEETRHHRGEHPGEDPRHPPHGLFEQVQLAPPHDGEQVGAGHRLLHALRGHERRPRGDRRPAEGAGICPCPIDQRGLPPHSRGDHRQGAFGGAAPRSEGPGFTAPLRDARRDTGKIPRGEQVGGRDRGVRLFRGARAHRGEHGGEGRVQAPPGSPGAQGFPQGVRHRPAHPHRSKIP